MGITLIVYPLILIVLPTIFVWFITMWILSRKTEIHPYIEKKITRAKVLKVHKDFVEIELLRDKEQHKIYFFPAGLEKNDIMFVSNDILESAVPEALRSIMKGKWFWRQNGDERKLVYTNERTHIK